jgi:hypothetical protein
MAERATRKQTTENWPTLYRWGQGDGLTPLMWRKVEAGKSPAPLKAENVPPWFPTGKPEEPFRFCLAMVFQRGQTDVALLHRVLDTQRRQSAASRRGGRLTSPS